MPHIELSINISKNMTDAAINNMIVAVMNSATGLKINHAPESDEWTIVEDGSSDDTPHVIGKMVVSDQWQPILPDVLGQINKVVDEVAERNHIRDRDRYINGSKVRHVLNEMEQRTNNTISNAEAFIDEAVVFLRAIELVAG